MSKNDNLLGSETSSDRAPKKKGPTTSKCDICWRIFAVVNFIPFVIFLVGGAGMQIMWLIARSKHNQCNDSLIELQQQI